jgi:hypothetical protein
MFRRRADNWIDGALLYGALMAGQAFMCVPDMDLGGLELMALWLQGNLGLTLVPVVAIVR